MVEVEKALGLTYKLSKSFIPYFLSKYVSSILNAFNLLFKYLASYLVAMLGGGGGVEDLAQSLVTPFTFVPFSLTSPQQTR